MAGLSRLLRLVIGWNDPVLIVTIPSLRTERVALSVPVIVTGPAASVMVAVACPVITTYQPKCQTD